MPGRLLPGDTGPCPVGDAGRWVVGGAGPCPVGDAGRWVVGGSVGAAPHALSAGGGGRARAHSTAPQRPGSAFNFGQISEFLATKIYKAYKNLRTLLVSVFIKNKCAMWNIPGGGPTGGGQILNAGCQPPA